MTELERRKESALTAINTSHGTAEAEYAATLFVSHHLEELDESYWQEHLHTTRPEPMQVLGLLTLKSHRSDENEVGIDILDFTLPEDATDYVLCVRFNTDGDIEEIEMES